MGLSKNGFIMPYSSLIDVDVKCVLTIMFCCNPFSMMIKTITQNALSFLFFIAILKEIIGKCIVGASVLDLCKFGDNRLMEETGKVFKKDKEMKKGE